MRKLLLLAACITAFAAASQSTADAGEPCNNGSCHNGSCSTGSCVGWSRSFANNRPWHGYYYNQNYGQPVAVVVPPNVSMQQSYSWGVGQNLTRPIYHQYGRTATGSGQGGPGAFRATPPWPSHTDQFGYYYVRSPW